MSQNLNLSPTNHLSPTNQFTTELSQAIIAASTLIENLRDDVISLKVEIASLNSKIVVVDEQASRLTKIVIEGDGQRALNTRMFMAEDLITTLQRDHKDYSKDFKDCIYQLEATLRDRFKELNQEIEEIRDIETKKNQAAVDRGWDILKQLVPIGITAIVSLAIAGFISYIDESDDSTLKHQVEQRQKQLDDK